MLDDARWKEWKKKRANKNAPRIESFALVLSFATSENTSMRPNGVHSCENQCAARGGTWIKRRANEAMLLFILAACFLSRHPRSACEFFSDGDDGDKQALPGLYRPSPRCSPFARHDETTDRRTCWVVGAWKAGGRGCGGGLKGGSKSLRNCEMQSCLRRIFFPPRSHFLDVRRKCLFFCLNLSSVLYLL